jgi:nicotinate-nucleotide adenylyltransferase
VGHVIVARDALEALGLAEVRFVVAPRPPHKVEGARASPELRLAMTEAAVRDDPCLVVETREMRREGPSYTVDTLRELTAAEPSVGWVLLLGADQLATFDTWREPAEVGRLARLVVMAREGRLPPDSGPVEGVVHEQVSVTRVDISSRDIRRRIAEGRSARFLVTAAVWDIIDKNELYRD